MQNVVVIQRRGQAAGEAVGVNGVDGVLDRSQIDTGGLAPHGNLGVGAGKVSDIACSEVGGGLYHEFGN